MKPYYVWAEIQANRNTIADSEKFRLTMRKCRDVGITGIILSVKDTSGYVLWNSSIAEAYAENDPLFEHRDYLQQCLRIAHEEGLLLFAAFDVFTEGNSRNVRDTMQGIRHPQWQVQCYGMSGNGEMKVQPVTSAEKLITAGSIDDFGEIFVNPGNPQVREYETTLIKEVAVNYDVDGIVLDRVRYVGLSTDFSEMTRLQWEDYAGVWDERWPEDVYTLYRQEGKGPGIRYGRYFGSFLTYRAEVTASFVRNLRKELDGLGRKITLMDYTGSWYPLYYEVGVNWASDQYVPDEYEWVDKEAYSKTGYLQSLDCLLSGFYYPDVTIEEARKHGKPADWYSVEGAADMVDKVTGRERTVLGSIFLQQYSEQLSDMTRAVQMCMKRSDGCMLFDLSYLEENDWWSYVDTAQEKGMELVTDKLKDEDFQQILQDWDINFGTAFPVSEKKLRDSTSDAADYLPEACFCVRNEAGKMQGCIAVKLSANQKLYPDTAWITLFYVNPQYRGKGWGRKLYSLSESVLLQHGVKKIYIGQDFNNLFSGIPSPDSGKEAFFRKLGYTLNMDEHYDLEADIVNNDLIDRFDTDPFSTVFDTEVLRAEDDGRMLDFIRKEDGLPERWAYEMEEYLKNHGDRNRIVAMKKKENDEICGFCMVSCNSDGDGGLGPIGIARAVRGHHVGDYILRQSLCQLRKIGGRRICIDWTILKNFYGQFGFTPVRTFRAGYKEF